MKKTWPYIYHVVKIYKKKATHLFLESSALLLSSGLCLLDVDSLTLLLADTFVDDSSLIILESFKRKITKNSI